MRKQSFLSLSVIVMLFLSGCSKENQSNNNPPIPQDPYSVSYSNWTADASLSWSDGTTGEVSRKSDLSAPEITQQLLDDGGIVLVYAKSNVGGPVQSVPALFSDENNNETNVYFATPVIGSISLSHTRSVNGTYELPDDSNEISFRYIVVKPNTPDPNGRQFTIYDLRYKHYKEVVDLLGISEL